MEDRLNNITKALIGIPKFGTGIGLHRMQYLCRDILASDWAQAIDPINITGSNGKGSTTAIVAAILNELGISNGQYTSPHLFRFTERIVSNREEVSIETLENHTRYFFEKQQAFQREYPDEVFGAFEAFTFIALSCFCAEKLQAIVLEAGIGGRYDSTRVMTGKFSALVSIDLEHTNLLGATEEQIAYDKLDIATEGSTVVVGQLDEDLLQRLKGYAQFKKITLLPIEEHAEAGPIRYKNGQMALDFRVEDYHFDEVTSNLVGHHQVNNILVAVLLLKHWVARNFPQIQKEAFIAATQKALAGIRWTGRLEKVKEAPPTYIDVGHTPEAISAVVSSFQAINKKPCLLVLGVSYDKELAAIIHGLLAVADAVVCTRAYHKGAPVAEIYKTVREAIGDTKPVFQQEKIEDAVDFSLEYAAKNDMCVLVAGGLFLSIEAYTHLKGNSPSQLNFF